MSKKGKTYGRNFISRTHDSMNTLENLFYSMVLLPNDDGCMLWTGSLTRFGYGQLRTAPRKTMRAHRFSYLVHFGDFDKNKFVCHSCDIPSCVAPGHLFLGTNQDNVDDCVRKNRMKPPSFKGSLHPNAKLNEEKVRSIKRKIKEGVRIKDIADQFSTHRDNIYLIKNGKAWRHVL